MEWHTEIVSSKLSDLIDILDKHRPIKTWFKTKFQVMETGENIYIKRINGDDKRDRIILKNIELYHSARPASFPLLDWILPKSEKIRFVLNCLDQTYCEKTFEFNYEHKWT